MKKRRIRNVNVCDLHDAKTIKRISKLSKDDDGVCFRFELPVFDEAFISYAKECIAILKRSQIDNYTFSMVTHNPDSTQGFVKTSTKILSTKELENLIELEELIPETANLVISEKFINKFYDFSLSDAIYANEFINTYITYIKSLKLSPFEEYLQAYDVVSKMWFNDANDANVEDEYKSRLLVSAFNDEYFVCVAHSKFLCGLLKGLGIKSQMQSLIINIGSKGHPIEEYHNNVMVYLCDPKYELDGIVFCDACNDSSSMRVVKTKDGREIHSSKGPNTMVLSAVNLKDVLKTKNCFSFEDENFLKFVYGDQSKLKGNDFKYIFDGFNDEYSIDYIDFFTQIYPKFADKLANEEYLEGENFEYLRGECCDFAIEKMIEVLGNIEVASAVERADLSLDDVSIVCYGDEVIKTYVQTVILKYLQTPEEEIMRFISSRKKDILEQINNFDKEYAVASKLVHNLNIAEKYGNTVSEVEPVSISDLFTHYKRFEDSNYAARMLFYFSKREAIADLIQHVRENSPKVNLEDYYLAYVTALIAQGFDKNKVLGFVNQLITGSVGESPDWFKKDASNAFRTAFNKTWEDKEMQS